MTAIVSLALLLLASVPSLHPFFQPQDLLLDLRLEGIWTAQDGTWTIERNTERTDYTLTMSGPEGGRFTASLFRLGDNHFIDLQPIEGRVGANTVYNLHLIPAHSLMRVWIENEQLRVAPMGREQVDAILGQAAGIIAHARLTSHDGGARIVLTAPTGQLQGFVQAQMERIFTAPYTLRKAAGGNRPTPTTAPGVSTAPPTAGQPLDARVAAERAATLANSAAEKSFGRRPFLAGDHEARLESGRWQWGERNPAARDGYSSEVSFDADGRNPKVEIFFSTDAEEVVLPAATPVPAVPVR